MTPSPPSQPSSHSRWSEVLELGEQDLLAATDRAALDAHVSTCADCAALLAADEQLLDALIAVVPTRRAPADLRAEVLQAVAAVDGAHAGDAQSTSRAGAAVVAQPPRRARRRRLGLLAAPTLAVIAVVAVGLAVRGEQQNGRILARLDAAQQRPAVSVLKNADVSKLRTTGEFDGASAQVVVADDVGIVAFHDVPEPPTGASWTVWRVDAEGARHPVGVLTPGRERQIVALDDVGPADLVRVMVTAEQVDADGIPVVPELGGVRVPRAAEDDPSSIEPEGDGRAAGSSGDA